MTRKETKTDARDTIKTGRTWQMMRGRQHYVLDKSQFSGLLSKKKIRFASQLCHTVPMWFGEEI